MSDLLNVMVDSHELHLVALLHQEFETALTAKYNAETCQKVLSQVAPFVQFAQAYLSEVRPRATRHTTVDNLGITLSNGRTVLISPPVEQLKGTMQSSTGTPVNPMPGAEDSMMNQGAYMITGRPQKPSPGLIDYSNRDGRDPILDRRADGAVIDYRAAEKRGISVDPFNRV